MSNTYQNKTSKKHFKACLQKKVSYFKNKESKTSTEITINELLNLITDKQRKPKFDALRSSPKYDKQKLHLPAVTLSGTFDGGHKKENLVQVNDLMQIDVDKLRDSDEVERVKEALKQIPFIFVTFNTTKGSNGIKAIALLPAHTADQHSRYFLDIEKYLLTEHNIKIDTQCKNINRLCFVPYSEFLYLNQNVTPYQLQYQDADFVKKRPKQARKKTATAPTTTRQDNGNYWFIYEDSTIAEKLDFIKGYVMKNDHFTPGHKHKHACKFALFAHKMDIPLYEAESYYYANFDKKPCNAFTFEYNDHKRITNNRGTFNYATRFVPQKATDATPPRPAPKNQALYFSTPKSETSYLKGTSTIIKTTYQINHYIHIPTQKLISKTGQNYDRKDYENATFNADILEKIKQLKASKIILLHDNSVLQNIDKGNRALMHFAKVKAFYYACQNANIPFLYSNGTSIYAPKPIENSLNLAYIKGIFEKSVFAHYKVKRYLSEIENVLYDTLLEKKMTLWYAPTGVGKNAITYRLIERLRKEYPHKKIFIGYDSNFANESKFNEYSNKAQNYYGLELKITSIDQYTDSDVKANLTYYIENSDVIQFCNNSFERYIKEYVKNNLENCIIILDEIHKPTTQQNIAPLDIINEILEYDCTKILMTGTPFKSFIDSYNVDVIRVEREISNNVILKCVELTDKKRNGKGFNFIMSQQAYEKAAMNFISSIPKNERKGKVHVIYFNDKKRLNRLAKHVKRCKMKADIVYSDDDVRMNSEAYNCLVNAKPIPMTADAPSRIILATSIAYESVNFTNVSEQVGRMGIFGENYPKNVIQAIARPRNAENLFVYYFRTKCNKTIPYTKQFPKFQNETIETYKECQTIIEMERMAGTIKSNKDLKIVASSIITNIQKRYYENDISQLVTKNGKLNKLKVQAKYEQEKTEQETNLQKFEELAKEYENISMQTLDISEIPTLFIDADNVNEIEKLKELASLADANDTQYEEIIATEKEEKKALQERKKELLKENTLYTLALYLDKDVTIKRASDTKNKLYDILSRCESFILNSDGYNEFKSKVFMLNNRDFFKQITIIAKRICKMSEYFDVPKQLLENVNSIAEILMFSKSKFHHFIRKMDTMKTIENDVRNDKDVLNFNRYKAIYDHQDVVLEKVYTRNELLTICKEVYQNFDKAFHFTEKQHLDTIKTLFKWEAKKINYVCSETGKTKQSRGIKLLAKHSYLATLQEYNILI